MKLTQSLLEMGLDPIQAKMEMPELFENLKSTLPRENARMITLKRYCAICGNVVVTRERMTSSTVFEVRNSVLCDSCTASHS